MSDRIVATGTKEDPHAILLNIDIGSTLPEEQHEKLIELCAEFLGGVVSIVRSKYENTQVVEAKLHEVTLTRITKVPEGTNVH